MLSTVCLLSGVFKPFRDGVDVLLFLFFLFFFFSFLLQSLGITWGSAFNLLTPHWMSAHWMCGLQLCWYLIKYSGLRWFLIFGHPSDTACFCLFLVPYHVVFIDRLWIVHYWASVNSTSFLQLFYKFSCKFLCVYVCVCVLGYFLLLALPLSSWSSEACSVMQKGVHCTRVCQWNLCIQHGRCCELIFSQPGLNVWAAGSRP